MKSVVIGMLAALVAAWAGLCEPASAAPGAPPSEVEAAAQPQPLSPVRHYSGHRRHRQPSRAERNAGTREPAVPSAIKPGLWEFAAQLQSSARPQSPQEQETRNSGASKTVYTGCIAADKAAPTPSSPQCTLDGVQRDGAQITWSMTCTNPQNSVRSDGVARYRGDTMEGTVISHLPGAGSAVSEVTQRITGRYLGPCTQTAESPPPSGPNAPATPPSSESAQWVEPPAASRNAKTSVSTAAPKRSAAQSRRNAGHRRNAYHRHYSGGVWPWGRYLPIPFLGGLF